MSRFNNGYKNLMQVLPIDITKYGALGDGATDSLAAYNAVLNAGNIDITNELTDPGINTDSNSDGIADGWSSYKDATVTGSLNMSSDGFQQINVTASTGAGGQAIYQDFAVNPGDIVNIGITYKSAVTSGGFVPWVMVYNSANSSSIKQWTLSNSTAYTNALNLQFTVPSGVTSIRLYFMARSVNAGDAGSITVHNATLSKQQSVSDKIIKFPQNAAGNAVYYFSSNPTLDNQNIACDDGVQLSFPSTNGVSFKKVNFVNNIDIISRDRNNTGHQLANKYSKLLFNTLTADDQKVGVKTVAQIADANISKNTYNASGGAIASATLTYDSTNRMYNGSGIAQNLSNVTTLEFPFQNNHMYGCLFSFTQPETNANTAIGVTATTDAGDWMLYYLQPNKNLVKGLCQAGVWSTAPNSKFSGRFTDAYGMSNGLIISCRPTSSNTIEIYVNGVLVDTVTTPFNFTKVGFGMIDVNATGAGLSNVTWGMITDGYCEKTKWGDKLEIVAFGDSITFGEGAMSWAEYLPYIIEGQRGIMHVDVNNQAVSGQNVAQQLSIMQGMSLSGYDVCVIMIGTNDIQGQTSLSSFRTNLQSMITQAKNAGNKVVVGMPPMYISQSLTGTGFADSNYEKGAYYRQIVADLCASNGVYFADTLSELGRIGTDNWQYPIRDNLHPNVIGQVALARVFARSVIAAITNE